MITVRQLLNNKGYSVYSVPPSAKIIDALKLMEAEDIGSVLVMDGSKLLGIFSERDYARRGVLKGCSIDTPVKEVMTKVLYYVGPDNTMDECMAQMTDKHIRHLPVVDQGKIIGVVSIGDVVKMIISEKEALIEGLEKYILGRESS
jgi:CBS domain-containing protein